MALVNLNGTYIKCAEIAYYSAHGVDDATVTVGLKSGQTLEFECSSSTYSELYKAVDAELEQAEDLRLRHVLALEKQVQLLESQQKTEKTYNCCKECG